MWVARMVFIGVGDPSEQFKLVGQLLEDPSGCVHREDLDGDICWMRFTSKTNKKLSEKNNNSIS
jgi:hypothetical protein